MVILVISGWPWLRRGVYDLIEDNGENTHLEMFYYTYCIVDNPTLMDIKRCN